VRKIVGHDRLVSKLAYQQLGELFQASRLLVNCFQPSMKRQVMLAEREHERRRYDKAKTPLERVLLSGVLPEQHMQELQKMVNSLDPLRLVQHLEDLQRAVWRCVEHNPEMALVRFSLNACVSASAGLPLREDSDELAQVPPDSAEVRDWSRSMGDPFLGEWEQIHSYVREYPMASGGEILREWQRRFPGRFVDSHLSTLQSRLREIRASLLAVQAKPQSGEVIQASSSGSQPGPSKVPETSPQADRLPRVFPKPVPAASLESEAAWPFPMPPTTEEDRLPLVPSQASAPGIKAGGIGAPTGERATENRDVPSMLVPPDHCNVDGLLSSRIAIDQAMRAFLQGEHTQTWDPKTREWHETALGQLQRYLTWRGLILLNSLTGSEIRGWLTFLRTESLATGAFRMNNTISTYARSVHAFCSWLRDTWSKRLLPTSRCQRGRSGVCTSLSRRPLIACFMPAMQQERNEPRWITPQFVTRRCSGCCGTRACLSLRSVR